MSVKNILLGFVMLLSASVGFGQKYQDDYTYGKKGIRNRSDSVQQLPIGLTGSNGGRRVAAGLPAIAYGYDTGQVRYNIQDSSIYVHTGFQFLKLLSSSGASGSFWGKTGDNGTTPGTHFVGTTDPQDLVFKTNNSEKLRIGTTGNIGINTSASLSKLHIVTSDLRGNQHDSTGIILENATVGTNTYRGQRSPSLVFSSKGYYNNFGGLTFNHYWRMNDSVDTDSGMESFFRLEKKTKSSNMSFVPDTMYRPILDISNFGFAYLRRGDGTAKTGFLNDVQIGSDGGYTYFGIEPFYKDSGYVTSVITVGYAGTYQKGSYNVSVGDYIFNDANTTGGLNTAMGYSAMRFNTTGEQNAAFGMNALLRNTTGIKNFAGGAAAGENNTTGSFNTFLGMDAGYRHISGDGNIYTGWNSGLNDSTGVLNQFYGYQNGIKIFGGNNNYVAGNFAGNHASQKNFPKHQILIGDYAFGTLDSAAYYGATGIINKSFIAGRINLPAYTSSIIGTPAYALNVDVSGNVITGGVAASSIAAIGSTPNANGMTLSSSVLNLEPASELFGGVVTTGTQTFAGAKSFSSDLTIGGFATFGIGGNSSSIKIGYLAMNGGTRNNSTAVGASALENNSSSLGGNTGIGTQALRAVTSGYNNTSVGFGSGYGITTGHDNTAIGIGAMGTGFISVGTTGITGNFNTAVGYNSLYYDKISSSNTAIGHNALSGSSLASTNGFNTGIGAGAGNAHTTGSYNVYLGGNDGSGFATKSKWMVFSDGFGGIKMVGDSVGNIGIGTPTPTEILHVVGNIKGTNYIELTDVSAPSTPASGFGRTYVRSDSLRFKNDAGTEFTLGAGGGGGWGTTGTVATLTGNSELNLGANHFSFTGSGNVGIGYSVASPPPFTFSVKLPGTDGSKLMTVRNSSDENLFLIYDNRQIYLGLGPSSSVNRLNARNMIGSSGTPTAYWHVAASTSSANTASLKFDEGSRQTTPEDGTVNYVANNLEFVETSMVYTLAKTLTNTATLDFPSVASLGTQTLTITVTGAADGDIAIQSVPNGSMTAGLVFTSWVSSVNTITIQCYNSTAGAIDPASGTFRCSIVKY